MDHFRNNTLAEGSLLPIDRLAQFPPISLRHAATRSARISTPAPPPPPSIDRRLYSAPVALGPSARPGPPRVPEVVEKISFLFFNTEEYVNPFHDTRKGRGNCKPLSLLEEDDDDDDDASVYFWR